MNTAIQGEKIARQPDYILKALNKETDEKSGRIGVAWMNTNGSLTLSIDMMVTLASNPNVVLTLFPNNYKNENVSMNKKKSENESSPEVSPVKPKRSRRSPKSMLDIQPNIVHRI